MGLLDGIRRRLAAFSPQTVDVGSTLEDVAAVRRALLAEAARRGTSRGLSLTLLMEHTALDLVRIDLFQVVAHLEAEGELSNLQNDSFGNVKFDLTPRLREAAELSGGPAD